MTTKQEALDIITNVANELKNLVTEMAVLHVYVNGEPEPPTPPGPDPGRPTAFVKVIVDRCHLRFIDHLDGAGKAVWGSYPKGSDNPKRDRYLTYLEYMVWVYMDGSIRWGKYKGAIKATGSNHGWEVIPGQIFNSHLVTGNPKLYILCKDAKRI